MSPWSGSIFNEATSTSYAHPTQSHQIALSYFVLRPFRHNALLLARTVLESWTCHACLSPTYRRAMTLVRRHRLNGMSAHDVVVCRDRTTACQRGGIISPHAFLSPPSTRSRSRRSLESVETRHFDDPSPSLRYYQSFHGHECFSTRSISHSTSLISFFISGRSCFSHVALAGSFVACGEV